MTRRILTVPPSAAVLVALAAAILALGACDKAKTRRPAPPDPFAVAPPAPPAAPPPGAAAPGAAAH